MFFNKKCCSSSALFSTFLSTTIQDDCKRRTFFRVFRGHVVFEGIFFFFFMRVSINLVPRAFPLKNGSFKGKALGTRLGLNGVVAFTVIG